MADDFFGSPSGEVHTVQDADLAAVLTDEDARRFYEPFIAQSCTVKEASLKVGCSLDTMIYRVRTFLRVGLLRITAIQSRKGRAIKHYRSHYDAYFVPHTLTPYANLEEQLLEKFQPYLNAWAASAARRALEQNKDGVEVYRNELGVVCHRGAAQLTSHRGWQTSGVDVATNLYLNPKEAQSLEDDLRAIFGRYQSKSAPSNNAHFTLCVLFYPK
jgi:hypothetical protein